VFARREFFRTAVIAARAHTSQNVPGKTWSTIIQILQGKATRCGASAHREIVAPTFGRAAHNDGFAVWRKFACHRRVD
ncbi:MAG: hypothetical protein WAN23_08755, partial [Candidatus Acidiferrales bacterium]